MRTAVVILNWNGKSWLQRFLPVVLTNTQGVDIAVADNGSTDGSLEWLAAEMPAVRGIALGTNHGFAGGYNKALEQVDAERYLLLNSDVEVTSGWLDALNSHLDAHPEMAACQPKVLAHRDRTRFEHAGAAGGYIDRNGYPFCRGRIFEITEVDHGQYNDCLLYTSLSRITVTAFNTRLGGGVADEKGGERKKEQGTERHGGSFERRESGEAFDTLQTPAVRNRYYAGTSTTSPSCARCTFGGNVAPTSA